MAGRLVASVSVRSGSEAGVGRHQALEAATEQATRGEQHNRQRELHDHQPAEEPPLPRAQSAAAPALLEHVAGVAPRRRPRRNQAADERGGQRQRDGKGDQAPVNTDLVEAWNVGRSQPDEQREGGLCQGQAQYAAGHCHDRGLDQHLPRETQPVGAKRRAQGHLACTCRRSSQEQARNVGARHQLHDANAGHQHQQEGADPTNDLVAQRRYS